MKGLSHRQKLFVDALRADPTRNGTKAAIAAGYPAKSAAETAVRLLKTEKVQKLLQAADKASLTRLKMTAEELDSRLAEIVRADLREAFNPDGSMKNPAMLPDSLRATLVSFEFGAKGKKFKATDRLAAIQLFYRRMGLLIEKSEVAITGTLTTQQRAARVQALIAKGKASGGEPLKDTITPT
jgi:phage terminase small subunit